MTNPADRFFGKTKIDALHIDSSALYIDGEQVIVTADELNKALRTYPIYNATGGALTVGMPLHISGYDATSGYFKVEKADANAGKPCQLFAQDTAKANTTTDAKSYYTGTANGIDCSGGAAIGDPVYLSATVGTVTLTKPTAADTFVQIVGRVGSTANPGKLILNADFQEISEIGYNEIAPLAFSGLTSVTPDMANDKVVISDATDSKNKTATIVSVATGLAGTAATTGLAATSGVMALAPAASGSTVGTDYAVIMTGGGVPGKALFSAVATAMAGEGLGSDVAGVLNLKDDGQTSHGGVFFTGSGDCDSITVGAVDYPRSATTADFTIGRWTSASGTASGNAKSLADAINGDTRATRIYTAEAIGAGVVIRAITPGTAGNVAVAKTGAAPAQPSTLQNLVEGISPHACKVGTVYHTVTAFDLLLTEFTLELPFSPNVFIAQVRKSTGEIRSGLTDQFNFDTSPLGVVVTLAGATHVEAGDIITVLALSL